MVQKTLRKALAIGTLCSFGIGGETYPCTVTKITQGGARVTTRDTLSTLTSGSEDWGTAVYSYTADLHSANIVWTLRKDGMYRQLGCKSSCLRYPGYRSHLECNPLKVKV
jgi:hypothetical protein